MKFKFGKKGDMFKFILLILVCCVLYFIYKNHKGTETFQTMTTAPVICDDKPPWFGNHWTLINNGVKYKTCAELVNMLTKANKGNPEFDDYDSNREKVCRMNHSFGGNAATTCRRTCEVGSCWGYQNNRPKDIGVFEAIADHRRGTFRRWDSSIKDHDGEGTEALVFNKHDLLQVIGVLPSYVGRSYWKAQLINDTEPRINWKTGYVPSNLLVPVRLGGDGNRLQCATKETGELYGYKIMYNKRANSQISRKETYPRLVHADKLGGGKLTKGKYNSGTTVAKCAAACDMQTSEEPLKNCRSFSFRPKDDGKGYKVSCILSVTDNTNGTMEVEGFNHYIRDPTCDPPTTVQPKDLTRNNPLDTVQPKDLTRNNPLDIVDSMSYLECATNAGLGPDSYVVGYKVMEDKRAESQISHRNTYPRLVDARKLDNKLLIKGQYKPAETAEACAKACDTQTSKEPHKNCRSFSFRPAGSKPVSCILSVSDNTENTKKVQGFNHFIKSTHCDPAPTAPWEIPPGGD